VIDDFYQAAMAAMRHHLDAAGAGYQVDDGELVVDGHRLGLSITFEQFESQGDLVLAPLDIQIHLDGDTGDRFRVGTLGVGADRETAMRDAINEWHLLAVAPLLAALGAHVGKRKALPQPQKLAGWDLFAGGAGIRGAVPAELRAGGGFYRTLISRLQQVVSQWEQPSRFTLRSIFFMATHGPAQCDVEAAVDGMLNEPLTGLVRDLPWPEANETYLYKQLFVLRAGDDR
jgi:hypothetical protein